jgi:hypothetical protein
MKKRLLLALVFVVSCGHTVFEQPPPPEPCRWECSKFCCVEICDPDSVWNEVCP